MKEGGDDEKAAGVDLSRRYLLVYRRGEGLRGEEEVK